MTDTPNDAAREAVERAHAAMDLASKQALHLHVLRVVVNALLQHHPIDLTQVEDELRMLPDAEAQAFAISSLHVLTAGMPEPEG